MKAFAGCEQVVDNDGVVVWREFVLHTVGKSLIVNLLGEGANAIGDEAFGVAEDGKGREYLQNAGNQWWASCRRGRW